MAAGLAVSLVSGPVSDRVTVCGANTGRKTMRDLNAFQTNKTEDKSWWTEVGTDIHNHSSAPIFSLSLDVFPLSVFLFNN